jgi:hypothetical protein
MPTTYEILGQINPSANTLTNVYSTGSSSAVVGTITIHNFSDSNASYSLIVRPTGTALNTQHFIIRGGVAPSRELITITGAVTMNANTILVANTNSGSISFNAYGVEFS